MQWPHLRLELFCERSIFLGTPTSEALKALNDLKKARARLLFSYSAVKTRLKTLQRGYIASKGKSLIERYKHLRSIVAEVCSNY